jgi:hypothetical protein
MINLLQKPFASRTWHQGPCIVAATRRGEGDARMKYAAIAMVTAFIVFGHGLPASAQTSVGGPKKQTPIGAARQNSPVLPVNKTAPIPAATINPPARPATKPVTVAAISPKHLKCAAGACVAKGSRQPK